MLKNSKCGAVSLGEILLLLVLIGSVTFVIRQRSERKAEAARVAAEEQARVEREAEAERERQELQKKREAEQAAVEAERRRLAEEARLLEEKERADRESRESELIARAATSIEDGLSCGLSTDKSFCEARYRMLKVRFADAEIGHITDASSADNPSKVSRRTMFWYVDQSFVKDGTIYELEAESKELKSVFALSPDGLPRKEDAPIFAKRMYAGKGVLLKGRQAWLCGVTKRTRIVKIPLSGGISPQKEDLSGAQDLLAALRCSLPHTDRYGVSLRNAEGVTITSIGEVTGDEELDGRLIDEALKKDLIARAREEAGKDKIQKPKLRKYTPKVVLYDGAHIKKEFDGTTRVPRTFQHLGTSVNKVKDAKTVDEFRKKWQALYDEAVRQEKKREEVARQNDDLMAKYKEQLERITSVSVSAADVAQARKAYTLVVERIRR